MLKKFFIFLFPLFILFPSIHQAQETTGIETWQDEISQIKQERKELREDYKKAQEKEKLKIDMKDQELIRYQTAYEKAILYISKDQKELQPVYSNNNIYTFKPVHLNPGEEVPKEYIPIYKEAANNFNVDWSILAAIHKIETDYSRIKIMRSNMGAIGHMQFLPATFKAYSIDGDGDGIKSAWNLKDSIHSAANYLNRSGYSKNPRKAIWFYNHAEWYVNKVINTAATIRNS